MTAVQSEQLWQYDLTFLLVGGLVVRTSSGLGIIPELLSWSYLDLRKANSLLLQGLRGLASAGHSPRASFQGGPFEDYPDSSDVESLVPLFASLKKCSNY